MESIESVEWEELLEAVRAGGRGDRARGAGELARRLAAGIVAGDELQLQVRDVLLRAMGDEAESVRVAACTGVGALIALPYECQTDNEEGPECRLTHIVAALHTRLSPPQTVEPAEELRLQLMQLLHKCISLHPIHVKPFYNDIVDILLKCSRDDYHEVKRETCETIVALADALPEDFHMRAEAMMQVVLLNLKHRHMKIRIATVKCIGAIVSNGNMACFESSVSGVALLLFDENNMVRLQAVKEIGNWMLSFRDRYSYWQNLIPLLLAGICDSSEEIHTEAKALWEKVGLQYMSENEDDFRDKLEIPEKCPPHLAPLRFNLGCRTLVLKSMRKIIQAIAKELVDWQSHVKLMSAKLLTQIVLHAGAKILYVDVIDCLLMASNDKDENFVQEICRTAEYLGNFVGPSSWVDLMLTELDSHNGLLVLANLIKGLHVDEIRKTHLKTIIREMTSPRLMKICSANYQMSSLLVCESLINVANIYCQSVSQEMFNRIFTIFAMPCTTQIENYALCLIEKLRETIKIGSSIDDFYCIYIRSILVNITSDASFWTPDSPEVLIMKAVLLHTGSAIGLHLHLISPLLVEVLTLPCVDCNTKIDVFTSLCSMLLLRDERLKLAEPNKVRAFMNILLEDVIRPNLDWFPGISAESLRSIAVCCLCAILQDGDAIQNTKSDVDFEKCVTPIELFTDNGEMRKYIDVFLPPLVGLCRDKSKNTRKYALKAIYFLVKLAMKNNCFREDHLHGTYSDVITCLDDSNDTIRKHAVDTLCALFIARPESYDVEMNSDHIEALYNAMLIHLDDPDATFRDDILGALKKVCIVHPKLLKGKVDANSKLYKNQKALEHLDKHLESLVI